MARASRPILGLVEALEHTYAYAVASAVGAHGVALATSGGAGEHPYLFSGWIERPAAHAAALLAVARTARSRFTPGTRVFPDPVVCSERERLRFEALSSCCGVYARYDLDLDGGEGRPGTTNVDFNPPLRDALARVGDGSPVHLAVGAEEVVLTSGEGAVVERKVPLPHRWVKGLGEVQLAQAEMEPRLELDGPRAQRLLRALPRSPGAGAVHVTAAGASARPRPGSIPVEGAERLRLLAPLLRQATGLRAWAGVSGASAWMVALPSGRLHLVLSPAPYRGFSGEGAVLEELADEPESALVGRAGYDLEAAAWFARELPFDLARIPGLHPRLVAGRALVDAGAVRLGDGEAWVRSSAGVEHRVVGERCTCPWWGRHGGARGPCKHALAVRIARG